MLTNDIARILRSFAVREASFGLVLPRSTSGRSGESQLVEHNWATVPSERNEASPTSLPRPARAGRPSVKA
jgi:hypothetical protein